MSQKPSVKVIDSSQYRELTDIEHVIKRATVYIGSTKKIEGPQYAFFGDGKIHIDQLTYVQGALVLASELINNAYDEYVKRRNDPNKRCIDNIDVIVNLNDKSLKVRDNGGIQLALHQESQMLLPSFLFGKLRTGGNYNDDDRKDVGGLNGMGSMLVNLFSKKFVSTVYDDGEHHYFQQTWENSSKDTEQDWQKLLHPCEPQTGKVEQHAFFDTTMMPEGAYGMEWARMIEIRCAMIAAMAAGDHQAPLTIRFVCIHDEGEWTQQFRFSHFQEYLNLFPNSDTFSIDFHERFSIALSLSGGSFESMGVVNGLACSEGTHIKKYVDACAYHIREHIRVRHQIDVKPAKILSYFKVVSAFKIDAPDFGGQTKERLVTDVADLGFDPIPSKKMIGTLLHSSIVRQIVEEMNHQIMAQRRLALQAREKERAKEMESGTFSPKIFDAALAGRQPGCTLFVVEGDSAAAGFKRHKKPDGTQGVLAMMGKSMGNVIYDDEVTVSVRPSFDLFMKYAGLSMVKQSKLRYDNFVLAQDADFDGNCITSLLLVFINKFFPWLIEQGRVYKLVTPISIATKGKDERIYYSYEEYYADKAFLERNGYEIKYHKGLSQIKDAHFKELMKKPKLVQITRDRDADLSMYTWFGKADENKLMRKEYLINALGQNVDEELATNAYETEVQDEFTEH